MPRTYYKLDHAIKNQSVDSVVISQEFRDKTGNCIFRFIVFNNLEEYIDNYPEYPNTHECICKDVIGETRLSRLIFDIDIDKNYRKDAVSKDVHDCNDFVHSTFVKDFEECLVKTLKLFNKKMKGGKMFDIRKVEFI